MHRNDLYWIELFVFGRNAWNHLTLNFCLNFSHEVRWFLSFRVFGLLSPSLLLYSQRVFLVELGSLHGSSNRVLHLIHVYHRTKVLCCKERSPQEKKYSNSKVREKNIALVFIQLWSLQLEKFLLLHFSRWWRCVCESWLFDTRLSQQIGRSRLGYDGSEPPEPLTHPFWQLPSTLPKSHYSFSYIEILENKSKIREWSMSLVKHVVLHLWLF